MTTLEMYNQAAEHHGAGRLGEAQELYRRILVQEPRHHRALHYLGMVDFQNQNLPQALSLIQQSIALHPTSPEYYVNLGLTLDRMGRLNEAIAAYGKALQLKPDYPQAHNNIGNAHGARGNWKQAIAYYQLALSRRPDYVEARYNMANALAKLARGEEAVVEYRRVVDLRPGFATAWEGLGKMLHATGRPREAVAAYEKSIALRPDPGQTHYAMGLSLHAVNRFDEAVAAYRTALALNPNQSQAHANLGMALKMTGRPDLAMESYERALQADPGNVAAHDALLHLLHFLPEYGPQAILARHQQYDEQYGRRAAAAAPFSNDRSAQRRLKIGYVSADFRRHAVGWTMLTLLGAHDHEGFETHCYAHVAGPDDVTRRLREKSDIWRDISRVDDEHAAQMVRSDKIDILVDLSLHMNRTRLLVLAQRPAPVLATYLGYCSTTGLSSVQYRLSDPHLDPPETELNCYTEQTVHLPRTYWCYQPCGATPDVAAAPSAGNGHVTFGCMNDFAKVSPAAMDLWAQILLRMPRSKLLLHCGPGSHRQFVVERFAGHGVGEDRLELVHYQQWPQYIESYQRIDVALDPFPYGGGITTCDALWMGVAVVTLSGQTAVGRSGRSILSNLGLPELIARTPEDYVRIATEAEKWIALRPTLREQMADSPLMDAASYARDVEGAYRRMWTQWTMQP